ncbi:hypothetical protein Dimus_036444 [Dionaea muscipula]
MVCGGESPRSGSRVNQGIVNDKMGHAIEPIDGAVKSAEGELVGSGAVLDIIEVIPRPLHFPAIPVLVGVEIGPQPSLVDGPAKLERTERSFRDFGIPFDWIGRPDGPWTIKENWKRGT